VSPAEWVLRADEVLKSEDLSAAERTWVLSVRNRKAWCVKHPKRLEFFLSPDQFVKFREIEKRVAKEKADAS
jgi:hypothetical protein